MFNPMVFILFKTYFKSKMCNKVDLKSYKLKTFGFLMHLLIGLLLLKLQYYTFFKSKTNLIKSI